MPILAQGAHDGDFPSPSIRWGTWTKTVVNAASPASQQAMKAKPVGFGRSVWRTSSTAGIIDTGDSATTSASGISSPSNDPAD